MMERKYPDPADKKAATPEKKQYAWEKESAERPTSQKAYAKSSGTSSDAERAKAEADKKALSLGRKSHGTN